MVDWKRHAVAAICLYEAVAIWSRKTPTVSALCWKRKPLIPIILGGLALHLIRQPKSLSEVPRIASEVIKEL